MCWIFKVNTGYRHQCLKNYGMTYAICILSILGPFIQSIVSLTSSLLVKMLTVLVRYFANAKATHIFSAKILAYMPYLLIKLAGLGGLVGCAIRLETRRCGFNPRRGRQHSFVEIDHEIFSTVILSLPLIQEGQLSVSGERMCKILVNRLEDKACPVNMWLGKLTALDMTHWVDWAVKPQDKYWSNF